MADADESPGVRPEDIWTPEETGDVLPSGVLPLNPCGCEFVTTDFEDDEYELNDLLAWGTKDPTTGQRLLGKTTSDDPEDVVGIVTGTDTDFEGRPVHYFRPCAPGLRASRKDQAFEGDWDVLRRLRTSCEDVEGRVARIYSTKGFTLRDVTAAAALEAVIKTSEPQAEPVEGPTSSGWDAVHELINALERGGQHRWAVAMLV